MTDDLNPERIQLVAAAALIDRDGRVLLTKRPANKIMGGLWEFPGGKIEAGETPAIALVRELKEELAINTEQSCLAPIAFAESMTATANPAHTIILLYACRRWHGTPKCIDVAELKWRRPNKINYDEMLPADKPLISILHELI